MYRLVIASGTIEQLTQFDGFVQGYAESSDGTRLVIQYRNALYVLQLGSGPYHSARLAASFGDREPNRLLWIVAMVQLRFPGHLGRKYFDRKRAEGKAPRAAMRCLKRQLAMIIFRLREDQIALSALPEVPLAT